MNRVEEKILEVGRTPLIGASMCRHDPDYVELCALTGFDIVWVDMEHSHVTFREAANLIRLTQALGLVAMIRVPNAERENLLRAAECGPDIIDLPMVNDVPIAQELVTHSLYAPQGQRGFFSFQRSVRYGAPSDIAAEQQRVNEQLCLMAQIETLEAVEAAEDICAVHGIDAILIGRGDLSVDLGVPGDLCHPSGVEVVERVMAVAKAAGKRVALPGPLTDMAHWVARGVDMYFVANDLVCLRTALQAAMEAARGAMEAAGS